MSLQLKVDKNKKKTKKPTTLNWTCKLNLEAKPNFIKLNFQAINISPPYFSKLSLLPINFNLTLTKPHSHNKSKSIKSKFLKFFKKLRFRSDKGSSASSNRISGSGYQEPRFSSNRVNFFSYEEQNYIVSIIIGFIALLSRSIPQRYQKGIIFYSLIILFGSAVIYIISLQRGTPFTDPRVSYFRNWSFSK